MYFPQTFHQCTWKTLPKHVLQVLPVLRICNATPSACQHRVLNLPVSPWLGMYQNTHPSSSPNVLYGQSSPKLEDGFCHLPLISWLGGNQLCLFCFVQHKHICTQPGTANQPSFQFVKCLHAAVGDIPRQTSNCMHLPSDVLYPTVAHWIMPLTQG